MLTVMAMRGRSKYYLRLVLSQVAFVNALSVLCFDLPQRLLFVPETFQSVASLFSFGPLTFVIHSSI